jgi:hypothetical protein
MLYASPKVKQLIFVVNYTQICLGRDFSGVNYGVLSGAASGAAGSPSIGSPGAGAAGGASPGPG